MEPRRGRAVRLVGGRGGRPPDLRSRGAGSGPRARGRRMSQVVASGEAWRGDFTVLRRDGDTIRVSVTSIGQWSTTPGEVVAIVGISEDVTEQRLLEREQTISRALGPRARGRRPRHVALGHATGRTEWDTKVEQLFGLEPGDVRRHLRHVRLAPASRRPARCSRPCRKRSRRESVRRRPSGRVARRHRALGAGKGTRHHRRRRRGRGNDRLHGRRHRTDATRLRTRAVDGRRGRGRRNERVSRERLEFLGEINDALCRCDEPGRGDAQRDPGRGAASRRLVLDLRAARRRLERPRGRDRARRSPRWSRTRASSQQRFPYDPNAQTGIPAVIRSGRSEFYPEIDEQIMRRRPTRLTRRATSSARSGSAARSPCRW